MQRCPSGLHTLDEPGGECVICQVTQAAAESAAIDRQRALATSRLRDRQRLHDEVLWEHNEFGVIYFIFILSIVFVIAIIIVVIIIVLYIYILFVRSFVFDVTIQCASFGDVRNVASGNGM